jgi:hypothetical protein
VYKGRREGDVNCSSWVLASLNLAVQSILPNENYQRKKSIYETKIAHPNKIED